ncbi:hypothetical protein O3P69_008072 [Scylla paramamosain]|uniref:Uncharacterized protein n=1 Tax=Scylla paramamosain TaxID=85552 RepID=A0AAW0SZP1_SCYPA
MLLRLTARHPCVVVTPRRQSPAAARHRAAGARQLDQNHVTTYLLFLALCDDSFAARVDVSGRERNKSGESSRQPRHLRHNEPGDAASLGRQRDIQEKSYSSSDAFVLPRY